MRNKKIDMCKGLGMLLVVIGHIPNEIGGIFYLFHMGFFFILSGYCFSDKHLSNGGGYLKKKFLSLMIPFLLLKFVAYIINYFSSDKNIVEEYHLIGTAWFLAALFGTSVICWVVIKMSRDISKLLSLVFLLLSAIIIDLIPFINIKVIFPISIWLYMSVFYMLGYILKSYYSSILSYNAVNAKKIIAISGGILFLVISKCFMPKTIVSCTAISMIPYALTTITGSYILLWFVQYLYEKRLADDTLSIIGQYNMSILLFQWPCISFVDYICTNGLINIHYNSFLFIAKLTAAISVPMMLKFLYNKFHLKIKE